MLINHRHLLHCRYGHYYRIMLLLHANIELCFALPIADAVRSLLDGHIVLSRELAWRNHYPCIDILSSISRLMPDLVPQAYQQKAGKIREWLSTHQKAEDMLNIGAYAKGSNPKIDLALKKIDAVSSFLIQRYDERIALDNAFAGIEDLTKDC